jgi:hypothetical protein
MANQPEAQKTKEAWEPMTLTDVGNVAEALHQGGGKLTQALVDPGETLRKSPGQEG